MEDPEKIYTQKDMDTAIVNVRIEERYIANQLMGDLGIPASSRVAPDGRPIYTEAADIVMKSLLKGPEKPVEQKPENNYGD